jgi:hypothetical protein
MSANDEPVSRAQVYAAQKGLALRERLGFGIHGIVFVADSHRETGSSPARCALKALRRAPDYIRERDAYLRLKACGVEAIRGCRVPRLLDYDDDLQIITMTLVTRPFVLDFAGAYLDRAPEFSEEVLADWLADKREQYGSRWPEVQAILAVLETYGIYMEDVRPGNISLGE